ncbi:kit ligand a [Megalops cyprinoides]|uniref:kit ligand a n=1 Tax=Megalops cyprinoides TaxID=118141 RepID=UPI0018650A12|nr:kit ligand a [Megalops cyprinoides]
MKKAKIWISACVCVFALATFVTCSSGIGNPITDDVNKVSLVKQNIPKDYKIPIYYIPKEVSGTCWLELNVYHLEVSLNTLAQMFGNISSNKENIGIFVTLLQDVRYRMGPDLEGMMQDFECHYREERWETARYFNFVQDFFMTARSKHQREDEDEGRRTGQREECEPPPCPTTRAPLANESSSTGPRSATDVTPDCASAGDCKVNKARTEQRLLSDAVEKSLLSLLLLPLAAAVLLLWKVRGRRRGETERKPENGELFTAEEGNDPPLNGETPHEKNRLSTMEEV